MSVIMSVQKIVKILDDRGLKLGLSDNGQPYLRGDPAQVTPTLKEALTRYRTDIIEYLREQQKKNVTITI